jgi:hypothetical protein
MVHDVRPSRPRVTSYCLPNPKVTGSNSVTVTMKQGTFSHLAFSPSLPHFLLRPPLPRHPLRLGDLGRGHFRGDKISQRFGILPILSL